MDGIFKKSAKEFNVVSALSFSGTTEEIKTGDTFKCHGQHYEVNAIMEQRKERTKPEATQPKRFWANVMAKLIK